MSKTQPKWTVVQHSGYGYAFETSAIANITFSVEADSEEEALAQARQANEDGGVQLRRFLVERGYDADIESVVLDGDVSIEEGDL